MKVTHKEYEDHSFEIFIENETQKDTSITIETIIFLQTILPDQVRYKSEDLSKRFVVRITPNGWIEYKIAVHAVNMIKDLCRLY